MGSVADLSRENNTNINFFNNKGHVAVHLAQTNIKNSDHIITVL